MHSGLNLRIGTRRARLRRVRAGAALLFAALLAVSSGPARAFFGTLPTRLETALAGHFAQRSTLKLNALTAENFALRCQLAALQPLQRENAALRDLLGSGRTADAAYAPAQLLAHYGESFVVYAATAPATGAAVLDRYGRFAGAVSGCAGNRVTVAAAGCGTAALPCTAAGVCGVLQRRGNTLLLAGLPRHSGLAAGAVVTTPGGQWVGRTTQAPELAPGGLTATAPLCETAVTTDDTYFLQK